MNELTPAELDDILQRPLSETRRRAFLKSFLTDREVTGTVRMLFKRSNALSRERARPKPEDVPWSGFSVLLQKAPFVDLPNWIPNRTWDFAVALENHLLTRFEQALREATEGRAGEPVNRDAGSVLHAFDDLAAELDQSGYTPSALVMAGPLGSQLLVDLKSRTTGHWQPQVKEVLGTTFRIQGMHAGLPILDIPESPSPAIYAVDIKRFAMLTEYGDKPEFELREIDLAYAKQLLDRNPGLVPSPPGGTLDHAEALRQLQLKAFLKLYETFKIDILNIRAAIGCPLTGPVLEWQPEYVRA